jgi:hypothetical protein
VVDLARFDGSPQSEVATRGSWLQVYHQLTAASADPARRPTTEAIVERARGIHDAVPIALLFDRYERLRDDAVITGRVEARDGRLRGGGSGAFEARIAFAAAALRPTTYRGATTRFVLDRAATFTNAGIAIESVTIDFGDGRGPRAVAFDRPVAVRYGETGIKTVRLEARTADGATLHASFAFVVAALATPSPTDTLHITGPCSTRWW